MKDIKDRTVNDVLRDGKKEFSSDLCVSHYGYSDKLIQDIYAEMDYPRHSRCSLRTVLSYMKYLLFKECSNGDDVYFSDIYFDGTEDFANMTIDELRKATYLPDMVRTNLIKIIKHNVNLEFTFDW